ncbi:MAG: hypothetical protein R6V57_00040 [Vicinamibacterales bacterium]
MRYFQSPWRRLLARALVLVLVAGAVPADCLAGEPPPGGSTPTLAASIQKAVAAESAKMGKARASTAAAKQDPGAQVNQLESKSFFKSPAGIIALVLVGVGTGAALYSTSNDRIKSPSK